VSERRTTNVLVYRFDPRFPSKQALATEVLRRGLLDDSVRLPLPNARQRCARNSMIRDAAHVVSTMRAVSIGIA